MNQAVPLYAVVIVVGAVLVLYLIHRMVSELHQSAGRISQAIERITKEMENLQVESQSLSGFLASNSHLLERQYEALKPAAEQFQLHMASVPKLLEAVARVGSAQLQLAQNQAKGNPFGKPNGPLPPRDAPSANLEYEVQELMRQGMSETEARMRLNPANDQSVWSNDNLFRGWDR